MCGHAQKEYQQEENSPAQDLFGVDSEEIIWRVGLQSNKSVREGCRLRRNIIFRTKGKHNCDKWRGTD